MAEFDTISLKNPTKADFQVRFNGEVYKIEAGEVKSCAKFVGFHIAKHLSTQMLDDDFKVKYAGKDIRKDNDIATEYAQMMVYDTPRRRIALYKILGDEVLIEQVIRSYPFKGMVGDSQEYIDFVKSERAKLERKSKPEENDPAPKTAKSKGSKEPAVT